MTSQSPTPKLEDLIHKRITLNTYVQGAAVHAFTTAHHLVQADLAETLPQVYEAHWSRCEKFTAASVFAYPDGLGFTLAQQKPDFWRKFDLGKHPFVKHPVLHKCGHLLYEYGYRHIHDIAAKRGVNVTNTGPHSYWDAAMEDLTALIVLEKPQKDELTHIAKQVCQQITTIDPKKLEAEITPHIAVGHHHAHDPVSRRLKKEVLGASSIKRVKGDCQVKAQAHVFVILVQELVKGTMEILSMYGVNDLDRETYTQVLKEADQLVYEPLQIQVGPELWRRFLTVLDGRRIPITFIRVCKMSPEDLHQFTRDVIENPQQAAQTLQDIEDGTH